MVQTLKLLGHALKLLGLQWKLSAHQGHTTSHVELRGVISSRLINITQTNKGHKRLESTLEMVQRWSVRRILHDFIPTSSASALVALLQLENLQSRRT